MHDDLIDFAVSDTWLAHYHAQGMTCRHPQPGHPRANDAATLMARVERLEQENAELRASKVRYVALPLPARKEDSAPLVRGVDLPQ